MLCSAVLKPSPLPREREKRNKIKYNVKKKTHKLLFMQKKLMMDTINKLQVEVHFLFLFMIYFLTTFITLYKYCHRLMAMLISKLL